MAALGASLGGLGDLFSRQLRGLLALSGLLSAALLGAGVWALIRFAVPLVPDWSGRWGAMATTMSEGAAVLVAVALALALWPIVAMIVSGVFFDVAADRLEARLMTEPRRGKPPSPLAGLAAGLRFATVSIPLNLLALPLYFIPGLNLVIAAGLNTFLLSRENYMLAALRYGDFKAAEAEMQATRGRTLLAALPAGLLSIVPVLNVIVPLWTLATMVRLRASANSDTNTA
jgi:CysZ protein